MATNESIQQVASRAVMADLRTLRFLGAAAAFAVLYAAVVGTVTAILPNPLFERTVPPTTWSYVFWLASAALFGPLAASYLMPPAAACASKGAGRGTTVGSVLSFLAVGCPVCNKLVVLALGASGAVTYFQPMQPWLGAFSLVLLGYAIWARFDLRGLAGARWSGAGR